MTARASGTATSIEGANGGPVLSDGTPLAGLIDVEHREVSMRLLSDPEVYQLELERLFARAWAVVAHESEIPRSGDYLTRYIGEDPVIVVRGPERDIHVLLNVCSHRGMKVCRAGMGSSTQFRCPYHGWTYAHDGSFLGAPVAREQMHGNVRSKSELGLRRARVGTFAGMIFATWDPGAPSLDEYLGHIKWYLELMFDRTDDGLEVLGPPQRFVVRANWKCPAEQHAGDGFHTMSLHRSLFELQAMAGGESGQEVAQLGVNVSWNGHGLRCVDVREPFINALKTQSLERALTPLEKLRIAPPPGLTPEMAEALDRRFSPEQLRVLADFPPQVGGLFPNMGAFSLPFPLPEGMSAIISWHAFVPRGPDRFEFYNWYFAERGSADELREMVSRASNLAFGASGFVETDDADTWPHMYQASRGYIGRQGKLRYQAITGENKPADWPAGGHVYDGFTKDDNQWNWWLRYAEFMTGNPW
ncbi:MAG: aromatic ring-hydroxylating oxygenase subunit alpha [Candidatus Binatia bacterium]